jgi:hypothetical protein
MSQEAIVDPVKEQIRLKPSTFTFSWMMAVRMLKGVQITVLCLLLGVSVAQAQAQTNWKVTTERIAEIADNESNTPPFWEYHQTTITRIGEKVFVSAMETVDPGFNSFTKQWRLFQRADGAWSKVYSSPIDQPLNQAPLLLSDNSDMLHLFVWPAGTFTHFSFNPSGDLADPQIETPDPGFSEFWPWTGGSVNRAGDILTPMVTGGDPRQHFMFRDRATDTWTRGIALTFDDRPDSPSNYDRHTFPLVALDGRAAHIFSTEDIEDPVKVAEGASYTYSSHKLDYYYSPDVLNEPFQTISVVDIEKTRGWSHNDDILLDRSGNIHLLYYIQPVQGSGGFSPQMHAFGPPGGPLTHVELEPGFTESRLWEAPDGTLYVLLPGSQDLYIAPLSENGTLAEDPAPLGISPGQWGGLFAGPRIFLSSQRASANDVGILEGIYRKPADNGKIELRYFRVENFKAPSAADFDGSGVVDFPDFLLFAAAFGTTNSIFDLTGDGAVGFADFLVFAGQFGHP